MLDDYHVIDHRQIHDGLAFFLDRLPPNVDAVIASRADPPFPIARFRARAELVEIRAADLRFAGDDRYILDYLVEEVLQRQPRDVHEFLLQTSVLNRLTSGPICSWSRSTTGASGTATTTCLQMCRARTWQTSGPMTWLRCHEARGDLDSALDLLGGPEPPFMIDLSPESAPDSSRARADPGPTGPR